MKSFYLKISKKKKIKRKGKMVYGSSLILQNGIPEIKKVKLLIEKSRKSLVFKTHFDFD